MKNLTSKSAIDVNVKFFNGDLPEITNDDNQETIIVSVCDTETTGLDQDKDEVIEVGIVNIELAKNPYRFLRVLGVYNGLREPNQPISDIVTKITGITMEDVKGQSIDNVKLQELVDQSQLIICHNAKFDRPFLEGILPAFADKPFACSLSEVDWSNHGFIANKLGILMMEMGYTGSAHRAEGDCRMTIQVLRELNELETGDGKEFFDELINHAKYPSSVIVATNSPFEEKDILKNARFFWDAAKRQWAKEIFTETTIEELQQELESQGFSGRLVEANVKKATTRFKLN